MVDLALEEAVQGKESCSCQARIHNISNMTQQVSTMVKLMDMLAILTIVLVSSSIT